MTESKLAKQTALPRRKMFKPAPVDFNIGAPKKTNKKKKAKR